MQRQTCLGFVVLLALCSIAAGAPASPSPTLYSLPYSPGEEFLVGYGYLDFPTHEGLYAIDWLMPEETPILAARKGVVVEAFDEFWKSGLTDDMKSKGNRLVIRHDDGSLALYLHLAQHGIKVRVGQEVAEGQEIALSGNTGFSSTPHLHFMVYRYEGGAMVSFPVLFKSGEDEPFSIVRGAKYRAPGGAPKPEEGPLKGIRGTGELSSIRPQLVALVKKIENPTEAALKLKAHLLANRQAYHKAYKNTFAKAQTGDKAAMRELQDFLDGMDLQTDPAIARLTADNQSANTAQEAMLVWWGLFSLP